ncbi:dihydrofolate reductase family protein [Streptomyces sp. NBC_01304]|uniref:dihydrofolate reductase family protein n=1 Tax=Streptomyces sp. NBC_01304 TaxID=2903818 RepID=UPI002E14C175|nr:dihydrofolate reductase family protein [Streptomyces sp. NBC_01304]
MGKVLYSMMVSLDGCIEDRDGSIEFSAPDPEVHRMANQQAHEASAMLFGRRMYEAMEEPWTAAARKDDLPEVEAEFARIYLATPRFVFSDTLREVPAGVQLVRSDEAVATVERLKRDSEGDLDLGGAGLAASLLDLVDEFRLYVMPVLVGGGKPYYPVGAGQLRLRLAEQRSFASGAVYLRYEREG